MEHASRRRHPLAPPREIVGLRQRVLVPVVLDAEVVGRRGDDHIHAVSGEVTKNVTAIGQKKAAVAPAAGHDFVRFEQDRHVPRSVSAWLASYVRRRAWNEAERSE